LNWRLTFTGVFVGREAKGPFVEGEYVAIQRDFYIRGGATPGAVWDGCGGEAATYFSAEASVINFQVSLMHKGKEQPW